MSGNTRATAKQNANNGARAEAYTPIGTREEALQALKSNKIVTRQSDIATSSAFSAALLRHAEKLKAQGQQQLQSTATDVKIYEAIAFLVVHLSNPDVESVKGSVLEVVAEAATELGSKVGDELLRIRGEVEVTNRAVEAIAKEVHAKVAKMHAPSAMSYSAAVANGGQTRQIDPRAQARTAIRYRQVRLKADPANSNIGRDKDNRELRRVIQTALEDIGAPADVKIDSVKRFPDTQEVLLEMDSESAVDWLRTSDRLGLLAAKLGTTPVARRYKTIGKFFPVTFDPKRHMEEFMEVNNIEPRHIESIDWFKPPERRSKGQLKAHVMIIFNDPKAANRAIARNVDIGHETCQVTKIKTEPILCRRCQRFNHLARDCGADREVCGTCSSDKHSTRDCTHRNRPRCVSCNEDGHPSYSRECPIFIRRCEDHDTRNPDNSLPFFPTEEPWTRMPNLERSGGYGRLTGPNSIPITVRQPNQVERRREAKKDATVRFSSQDEYEPTPQYMHDEEEIEEESQEEDGSGEDERQRELDRAAEDLDRQQREAQEEVKRLMATKKAIEEKKREIERERERSRSRSRSPTGEEQQQDDDTSRGPTYPNGGRSPKFPGQWDTSFRHDEYNPDQPGGSQRTPAKSFWGGDKSYGASKGRTEWPSSQ